MAQEIKLEPNRLYDFDMRELNLLYMGLASIQHLANNDVDVPAGLTTTLDSAINKIQTIMELRCNDFNEFQDLVENSLTDLSEQEQQIVKEETENK